MRVEESFAARAAIPHDSTDEFYRAAFPASAAPSEPAIKKLSITAPRRDDDREPDKRPLDLRLITRLIGYMRPYAGKRNWLFVMVILRSIQLPLVAWSIGAVIDGPIAHHAPLSVDPLGRVRRAGPGRQHADRVSLPPAAGLELGEAVIHDLRQQIFAHLQRMPMSFYNKTKIGRIISRVTSDCEALRVGVQDVLFVSLVGVGQMLTAAAPDAVLRLGAVQHRRGDEPGAVGAQPLLPPQAERRPIASCRRASAA